MREVNGRRSSNITKLGPHFKVTTGNVIQNSDDVLAGSFSHIQTIDVILGLPDLREGGSEEGTRSTEGVAQENVDVESVRKRIGDFNAISTSAKTAENEARLINDSLTEVASLKSAGRGRVDLVAVKIAGSSRPGLTVLVVIDSDGKSDQGGDVTSGECGVGTIGNVSHLNLEVVELVIGLSLSDFKLVKEGVDLVGGVGRTIIVISADQERSSLVIDARGRGDGREHVEDFVSSM